jgi:hypothetical protein
MVALVKWAKETPSVTEALQELQLDYSLVTRRLLNEETKERTDINGLFGCIDGQERFFAAIKDRYQAIDNKEWFGQLNPLVENGSMKLRSGGMMHRGGIAFLIAELQVKSLSIPHSNERILPFTLFAANHEGRACKWKAIPFNPFCSNQVMGLLRSTADVAGYSLTVRHRGDVVEKLDTVSTVYNKLRDYYSTAGKRMQLMAGTKYSKKDVTAVLDIVHPLPEGEKTGKAESDRNAVLSLLENEQNSAPVIRGSWWSLTNAVSEFLTHEKKVKGEKKGSDEAQLRRLEDTFFGRSLNVMDKVYELVEKRLAA